MGAGGMIQSDEHWLALTDAFYSAAIDGQSWYFALEGLAEATGSQTGELIGLGNQAAVPFNIVTNIDPDWAEQFVAHGGGDPGINPRVGLGSRAPPLTVLSELDFRLPESYTRNPQHREYESFMDRTDRPYICLSPLERQQDMLIGLAVARSRRDGHITNEQRSTFTALAPHVRAAVRMQIALEGQGANLLMGAMETLSIPVFICDRSGQVQARTPATDQHISGANRLQLKQDLLYACQPADNTLLQEAIDSAANGASTPGLPVQRTVVLHSKGHAALPLVLDVMSLPSRQYELCFAPRVLVIIRGKQRAEERQAVLLQTVYGLTPAETQVALQLVNGETVVAIADSRSVAVDTVRTQIKSIFGKAGVQRQVELFARIAQL